MKAFPIWCLELVHARRQNNWIAFISENLNYLLTVYLDFCKSSHHKRFIFEKKVSKLSHNHHIFILRLPNKQGILMM